MNILLAWAPGPPPWQVPPTNLVENTTSNHFTGTILSQDLIVDGVNISNFAIPAIIIVIMVLVFFTGFVFWGKTSNNEPQYYGDSDLPYSTKKSKREVSFTESIIWVIAYFFLAIFIAFVSIPYLWKVALNLSGSDDNTMKIVIVIFLLGISFLILANKISELRAIRRKTFEKPPSQ